MTAKVREQPFAVLLFDEFEKADPSFFDLLLQMLGEARLTDAGGRLADFRNAVVVLTSNLGAETFQRGAVGFGARGAVGVVTPLPEGEREAAPRGVAGSDAKDHFTRAVESFLRPELYNRLDRLVPFAPLDAATVSRIARREWAKVLARDGIRFRGAEVIAGDDVLDRLAAIGFYPRYGARPLKRAIEREVLAPLAHQMNRYPADVAVRVEVAVRDGDLTASVRPRTDERGRVVAASDPADESAEHARAAGDMRRLHQRLATSTVVRELENEITQLALLDREMRKQRRKDPTRKPSASGTEQQMARLARLRDLAGDVTALRRSAFDHEDAMLLAFYGHGDAPPDADARLAALERDGERLLYRLFARTTANVNDVTVALFCDEREPLFELAAAYAAVASANGLRTAATWYALPESREPRPLTPKLAEAARARAGADGVARVWRGYELVAVDTNADGEAGVPALRREEAKDAAAFLGRVDHRALGILLRIRGEGAFLWYAGESGLHEFQGSWSAERFQAPARVWVSASNDDPAGYVPPEWVTRRGGADDAAGRRRTYKRQRGVVADGRLDREVRWDEGGLADALAGLLALGLRRTLERMVLE